MRGRTAHAGTAALVGAIGVGIGSAQDNTLTALSPSPANGGGQRSAGEGVTHWYDGGWESGVEPDQGRSDGIAHVRAGEENCDGNWRRGPDVLCLQEVQVHNSYRSPIICRHYQWSAFILLAQHLCLASF